MLASSSLFLRKTNLELRHRLSQDLRRLVTGRMTNDDFDDAYYDSYMDSDDLAIREISRFGWSLYSSDVLFSYKLRGRHRVSDSARKTAAHAVLFLQTENAYGYPETSDSFGDSMVGCAWFNGSLVGVAFGLIGGLAFFGGDAETGGYCLAIGFAIIVACFLVAYAQFKQHDQFREECDRIGDMAIWPFFDRNALADANGNNYLLSNFEPDIAT